MHIKPTSNRGFTLIEMVTTIIISSILAMGIVSFIADSVEGFSTSSNRSRLAGSGRAALDRMTFEIHNALPNSVRVTAAAPNGDQCIEFMPALKATTYINPPIRGTGATSFDVINFDSLTAHPSPAGIYAAIYPISTTELYNYDDNLGPLALIDSISDTGGVDGKMTVTLDASHRFNKRSPNNRLFLVDEPVSFCVVEEKLYRYSNYGVESTQCTPDTCLPSTLPDRALLADSIDNAGATAFSLGAATTRRNAIVSFDILMTSQGDIVRLNHEVLTHNVP